MKVIGCWFHFNQRVWAKTQKLGLSQSFKNNLHIAKFIRQLMAVPFLPAPIIAPTFSLIEVPVLPNEDMPRLEKLKNYLGNAGLIKYRLRNSPFMKLMITNNGVESYHSKLKSRMRCKHPNEYGHS